MAYTQNAVSSVQHPISVILRSEMVRNSPCSLARKTGVTNFLESYGSLKIWGEKVSKEVGFNPSD